MQARYETVVRAKNNAHNAVPVTVYADNRQDAVNRAVALGWNTGDSTVIITHVEEIQPDIETVTILKCSKCREETR